jgi:hypothetical protein
MGSGYTASAAGNGGGVSLMGNLSGSTGGVGGSSTGVAAGGTVGTNALYGGGGSGNGSSGQGAGRVGLTGGVRIIWPGIRQFPSTSTGDL